VAEPPPSSIEPTSQPSAEPQTTSRPPPTPSALIAVFTAIAKILAVRLQLLLALIGAFVLALLAMSWQSNIGLAVLAAYCCLTVIPLIWLAWPDRGRAA
jgi:hypothetical protein